MSDYKCIGCGGFMKYGESHTCPPASDPVPVEGVVLPEVEILVPECCGMDEANEGQIERGAAYVRHSVYVELHKQLAEAIAQRDTARQDVFRLCTGHGLEDFVSLRDRATVAEAALATERAEKEAWRVRATDVAGLLAPEINAQRARVLQEAADVLSHGYAQARSIVLNMIDK